MKSRFVLALLLLFLYNCTTGPNSSGGKEIKSEPATHAEIGDCSAPINGNFKLRYSGGPVVHEATLYMNGCYGKLITTFFDAAANRTERVEQAMRSRSTSQGMLLMGYEPVYAGTNKRHPNYSADNFLFQQNINGSWKVVNCDDNLVCSPVEVLDFWQ